MERYILDIDRPKLIANSRLCVGRSIKGINKEMINGKRRWASHGVMLDNNWTAYGLHWYPCDVKRLKERATHYVG